MMYIVKENFKDETNNHIYKKDDIFPFEESVITDERINELSTIKNKIGKILIEESDYKNLTENQLIAYSKLLNIDISNLIVSKIVEMEDSKKLEELKKTAINMKVEFDENVSIEELEKLISKKEKGNTK